MKLRVFLHNTPTLPPDVYLHAVSRLLFHVWRLALGVGHWALGILFVARRLAFGVWRLSYGLLRLLFGVWRLASSHLQAFERLAFTVWACGVWRVAFSIFER